MTKYRALDQQSVTSFQNAEAIDTFDNIYHHYVNRVYNKCLTMTNDPEMAKDFTQDIFIKVFMKLKTFQNRSAFSTWLYAISHNYCIDHIRASKRTEPLSDAVMKDVAEQDLSPHETVISQWRALSLFLTSLPDDEVDMLRLKYEQGVSVKTISEYYNLSESSIKMRLKRSRDKLRALCITAISDQEKQFQKPVNF
ncbi:sigma-70 family RNA polymerase sigma factor [Spirosoma aureum]|uniref:Sigma-70 family RNA polymerase sigma factor n=1 Tax=Spirosoma aureum TaxID=2692134 RepID=A0A6G9ATW3_9BACT|nr:sigma-70 family RNA polymerase sigma factor [Spirosoma aureum]QIP15911.1 sigma-70 family RNA polymerase sigma factor [Spirosoma aureum]